MGGKKNILIVDDADFLSKILKVRLNEADFGVDQVSNGEEALRHLGAATPDLILLDLIMPKMSGFEFLEKITADRRYASIPVVILSNLAQDEDRRSVGDKAKSYLVKAHVSVNDIVAEIKKTLNTL